MSQETAVSSKTTDNEERAMNPCVASLLDREGEDALDFAVECRVTAIEPCAGGYDNASSIELQEPYMTTSEALHKSVATLAAVIPADGPPAGNWFWTYSSQEVESR
jgi:hypothetical protein